MCPPLTVHAQLHGRAGRGAREGRRRVCVDAAVVGRVDRRDVAQLKVGLRPRGAQETLHPALARALAHQEEAHAGAGGPAPQLHQRPRLGTQSRGLGRQLRRRERPCGEDAARLTPNAASFRRKECAPLPLLPPGRPACTALRKTAPSARRPGPRPPWTLTHAPTLFLTNLCAHKNRRVWGRVLLEEHPRPPPPPASTPGVYAPGPWRVLQPQTGHPQQRGLGAHPDPGGWGPPCM